MSIDLRRFDSLLINVHSLRFLLGVDWLESFLLRPSSRSLQLEVNLIDVQVLFARSLSDLHADALLCSLTLKFVSQGSLAVECLIGEFSLFLCQLVDPHSSVHRLLDSITGRVTSLEQVEVDIPSLHLHLSPSMIVRLFRLFGDRSLSLRGVRRLPLSLRCVCREMFISLTADRSLPLAKLDFHRLDLQVQRVLSLSLTISLFYWNGVRGGFEPLFEPCPLALTVDSSLLISVHSKEMFNVNITPALLRLTNECSFNPREEFSPLREILPVDRSSVKNLLGLDLTLVDCSSSRQWLVRDGETMSLECGEDEGQARVFLSFGDWTCSSPICIGQLSHFFRLARSSSFDLLVLLRVEISEESSRLLTVRSAMSVRNRLPMAIDVRWKDGERRVEAKESFSLPVGMIKDFQEIQIRPADFGFDFSLPLRSSLHCCSNLFYVTLLSKERLLLSENKCQFFSLELSVVSPLLFFNLLPSPLTIDCSSRVIFSLSASQSSPEQTCNPLSGLSLLLSVGAHRMKKRFSLPRLLESSEVRLSLFDGEERELSLQLTIVVREDLRLCSFRLLQ